MRNLRDEVRDFLNAGEMARANAAQLAALQCVCGLDLTATMKADAATRTAALNRIGRLAERERMKGLAGHWSYDLNRHIALKQAADRLRGIVDNTPARSSTNSKRRPKAPSSKSCGEIARTRKA
jgi:hypothetical protein